jgi:2-aminoadipate transaminase
METRIEELQRHASHRPGVISLAGGLPADELLPRGDLTLATTAILSGRSTEPFQYGWAEGCRELRAWIADRLVARGAAVDADDVIVTAGAQQALALIAATLPRGTRIVVDTETYPCAMHAFEFAGLEVVTEPLHPTDVRYVIDGVSNPHGVDRVGPRRAELLASGAPIIVDEAYAELRFDGRVPRPLVADAPGRVWHVGTLSKVISPGLRVGWVVAPRALHHRLLAAKQAADLQTCGLAQAALARLLATADYDQLLDRARNLYAARAAVLVEALRTHAPGWRFAEPVGGFSIWVETDLEGDDVDVLAAAVSAGTAFDPGRVFRPGGEVEPVAFRLSFSHAPVHELEHAVRRLVAAARKFRHCDRIVAA